MEIEGVMIVTFTFRASSIGTLFGHHDAHGGAYKRNQQVERMCSATTPEFS